MFLLIFHRAANETRTRDPNLGKVMLYQLSYCRKMLKNIALVRKRVQRYCFFLIWPNIFEKKCKKSAFFWIFGRFNGNFSLILAFSRINGEHLRLAYLRLIFGLSSAYVLLMFCWRQWTILISHSLERSLAELVYDNWQLTVDSWQLTIDSW